MKTLQEVLNTDLSAEKVKDMSFIDLAHTLISNEIVNSVSDLNMLIVEGIQRALNEDDEFPIRYYKPDEEMPETAKVIENPGEMLTDDLVHQMKGVNK